MLTTGARSASPGMFLSEASMSSLLGRAEIAANDSLLRGLYGNYCKNMQEALSVIENGET
ncbi:MAG: hypothetical protein FWH57_05925 [Oscillospiraceae bacterium]|nr:hypothetical protein [Oscillospiraceae bacterium]